MSADDTEKKLKTIFNEQKRQIEQNSLSFNSILQKQAKSIHIIRRLRLVIALLVVFIFIFSPLLIVNNIKEKSPSDYVDFEQWETLTNWRGSTDSLLVSSQISWENMGVSSTDSLKSKEFIQSDIIE